MTIRVRAARVAVSYPVRVSHGLLERAGPILRSARTPKQVLVVTDRTVERLHAPRFLSSLRRAGFDPRVIAIQPGERSKTPERVRSLCDRWAEWRVGRSGVVLALGGGVVSDVAGFAAASYARGLDWYVFPTTLLAQADASIGGKVGVNLRHGKNLLGAFHHPRGVFSDPLALRTLAPRAFRSGLAEIVKMGVIRRPAILRRLRRSGADPDRGAVPLIRAAAKEKAWYVSRDPEDRGIRRELNFGHTVGHELEAALGYGRITHGEAVSIGMVAALRMSVRHAGLDPEEARSVEELLRALGLPTRLWRAPRAAFWSALERDKKRGRSGFRMVLSPGLGSAKTYDLPSLTPLRGVILSLVRKP